MIKKINKNELRLRKHLRREAIIQDIFQMKN